MNGWTNGKPGKQIDRETDRQTVFGFSRPVNGTGSSRDDIETDRRTGGLADRQKDRLYRKIDR